MKGKERQYVRRSQKDYPMSFKLAVVREYEENKISLGSLHRKYGIQGSHTVRRWLEKYGNFDWENKDIRDMGTKTKEQELLELRQKVKELERKNTRLEKELDDKDHKVAFFDLMIDMAEKEFKVDIRKKIFPRAVKGYTKENTFSINRLCKLLGVSRMVYYRSQWSIRRSQCRASEVVDKVQELRMYMPRIGTRKSYHLLNKEMRNLGVGRDKMFDILRANHMLLEPKRSYHITTNSHHRFHKYKNIVENLDIRRPEQVWVADITYIGGRDKHCYLSLVTDAYSKKIVGFDLSNSLDTSSCIRALNMAKRNRTYPEEPLIHHSDRGIQYCSNQYQAALSRYSITPSMTESYDPYANAVAERVNGILKQEFFLEDINLSLPMMKHVVSDAIRTYNTMRPHLSCSYLTPEQMHHQSFVKIKKYKSKKISIPAS